MKDDFLNPEHREYRVKRMRLTHKKRMADPTRKERHKAMQIRNRKKVHPLTAKKVFAQYRRAQWAQLRRDFEEIQMKYLRVA